MKQLIANMKKQLFSFSIYRPTLIYSIYNYFMNPSPAGFRMKYHRQLAAVRMNPGDFRVTRYFICNAGRHPVNYVEFECAFAASQLSAHRPTAILDIGSYRAFILGLLAHYKVTTIDVRERKGLIENEKVINSGATKLAIPDNSYDAITTLCSLEHFGLGRYGDDFDLDADTKAISEMKRVLKPGGMLIFTTGITRGRPTIAFNAGRSYSIQMLRSFCQGMECVKEQFYSFELERYCSFDEITTDDDMYGVYMGSWKKPITAGE